jgi:AAHS family 4-hydroxybenzoate transporter-like MFS transporter
MEGGMTSGQTIDVSALIEDRPVTAFQWRTLLVCLAVLFMDGYDTQAIGYVSPALVQAWHLDKAALAPVFALGLVGMMLGGLFFGPLADRFGRKRFIVICTALFGVFSLLTAATETPGQLMVLRLLTGLGLGGAMPNAVALVVEYFPKRRRASAVTMVFVGFTIGAAIGGFAVAGLLRSYGWPVVFVIGGIIPLILVPLVLVVLPESLAFLILRGRPQAEILRPLLQLAPDLKIAGEPHFIVREETGRGVPVKHLFTQGRAMPTLLLWVLFFLALMITYMLASWTPIAFNSAGVPVGLAVSATGMWQTGSIIGTLCVGQLMDRFEPFRVLAIGFVVSACAVLLMTQVDGAMSATLILGIMLFCGICTGIGGLQGVNALAGWYYPAFIRTTGLGWAIGMGRLGSISGTLLGGLILTLQWQPRTIFLAVTIAQALGVGVVLAIRFFEQRRIRAIAATA